MSSHRDCGTPPASARLVYDDTQLDHQTYSLSSLNSILRGQLIGFVVLSSSFMSEQASSIRNGGASRQEAYFKIKNGSVTSPKASALPSLHPHTDSNTLRYGALKPNHIGII